MENIMNVYVFLFIILMVILFYIVKNSSNRKSKKIKELKSKKPGELKSKKPDELKSKKNDELKRKEKSDKLKELEHIKAIELKGEIGEKKIAERLTSLSSDKYKVLNNIMLKHQDKTTQIDHIIVSPYGIFVIETKNYVGKIYGNKRMEKWQQYSHGKQYHFYNPTRQNYAHVKALEELLRIPSELFKPIVVFSSDCEINIDMDSPVVTMNDLLDTIYSHKSILIQQSQVKSIYEKIRNSNIDSKKNREIHIANINNLKNTEKEKIARNICPKCNGALILKHGKRGEFMGCDRFPKCRYTHEVKIS